ncbi:PQQ-binding-like beta-propeller repeat protein [Haloarchaeobius sp. HRN-SO-5]|uniref:outer membrane protein assembly factor BamB family protein n=1 Tax=Haloarchaeobius sp. HRN-SO-5 TaxID=3446118 RepID=UPI003EC04416
MPSRRRFLSTLGTTGTAVLAGCTDSGESVYSPGTDSDTEWPMPAYDRGFSAYNPDAAAPRDGVTERWSTEIPPLPRHPVVAAGTVLVPTISGVVALDVGTGEERWRHGSEHSRARAAVVDGGTAYVSFGDPRGLVALDVETGDQQWHVQTTGYVDAAPTFDREHDSLYVGDDTGRLYEIDSTSGEVTDRTEVFGPVTALAHNGLLLVGTGGGEVYNFRVGGRPFTGQWRRRVVGAVTALVSSYGNTYVATWGGPVYRLQGGPDAGSNRWEADRGAVGGLAAAHRDVVGWDLSGLRTFDARTGNVRWDMEGRFTGTPAIAGDTVYVGRRTRGEDGTGFVAAYALSGGGGILSLGSEDKRWQYDVESDRSVGGIAVADGAVFASTKGLLRDDSGPRMYALDPA